MRQHRSKRVSDLHRTEQRSIALAEKVQDLARKRVDAEQKKYDLGTDDDFFVSWLRKRTCTLAESTLVREARIDL